MPTAMSFLYHIMMMMWASCRFRLQSAAGNQSLLLCRTFLDRAQAILVKSQTRFGACRVWVLPILMPISLDVPCGEMMCGTGFTAARLVVPQARGDADPVV